MSKVVRLRAIAGGPSGDVMRMIADAKRRLRHSDIRAIAVVYVYRDGEVGTAFAGHRDGFMHELVSATTHLGTRLQDEMERR